MYCSGQPVEGAGNEIVSQIEMPKLRDVRIHHGVTVDVDRPAVLGKKFGNEQPRIHRGRPVRACRQPGQMLRIDMDNTARDAVVSAKSRQPLATFRAHARVDHVKYGVGVVDPGRVDEHHHAWDEFVVTRADDYHFRPVRCSSVCRGRTCRDPGYTMESQPV
jgi:hypothetical protein